MSIDDKFTVHTKSRLMIEELEKALSSIQNQMPETDKEYLFADEVNESFESVKSYITKIIIPALRENMMD